MLKQVLSCVIVIGVFSSCGGANLEVEVQDELITTGSYPTAQENEELRKRLIGEWKEGITKDGPHWVFKQDHMEWNGYSKPYLLFGDTLEVGAIKYLLEEKQDSSIQLTIIGTQQTISLRRE